MNFKKCEKGHFYDTDKFVNCPYCETETDKIPGVSADFWIMSDNDATVKSMCCFF